MKSDENTVFPIVESGTRGSIQQNVMKTPKFKAIKGHDHSDVLSRENLQHHQHQVKFHEKPHANVPIGNLDKPSDNGYADLDMGSVISQAISSEAAVLSSNASPVESEYWRSTVQDQKQVDLSKKWPGILNTNPTEERSSGSQLHQGHLVQTQVPISEEHNQLDTQSPEVSKHTAELGDANWNHNNWFSIQGLAFDSARTSVNVCMLPFCTL